MPYQLPISADRDTGERDAFWGLLRRWTIEQGALFNELDAELERAGQPARPFPWSRLPPEAQDAVARMQDERSVPTREPAAFRGICTTVRATMSESTNLFGITGGSPGPRL